MARYANDSLKIHTTVESSAVVVGGITNFREDLNSQLITPDTADLYDLINSLAQQMPELQFTTTSLDALLELIPLYGKCITQDGTHPGVIGYQVAKSQCATHGRASGANQRSATIIDGHMFLESLSCNRNQDAVLVVRAHALTPDGTTQPVVFAYNASLPASPTLTHFTIGKPTVASQQIDKVLSVNVQFNPTFQKINEADSIWPDEVDIQKVRSIIRITTEDPSILDGGIADDGEAVTHATGTLRFIKRKDKDAFESFVSEVHITGTFDGFAHVTQPYSASGAGAGQAIIEIATMDDGTNEPIVWDVTAAYSVS